MSNDLKKINHENTKEKKYKITVIDIQKDLSSVKSCLNYYTLRLGDE